MKTRLAHDFEWLPKPRSPRRWPTIAAFACLGLAVLMLARSEERGPRRGFAPAPVPHAAPRPASSIDAAMIVNAPAGIDDRMIIAAPSGIDDAMVVDAAPAPPGP